MPHGGKFDSPTNTWSKWPLGESVRFRRDRKSARGRVGVAAPIQNWQATVRPSKRPFRGLEPQQAVGTGARCASYHICWTIIAAAVADEAVSRRSREIPAWRRQDTASDTCAQLYGTGRGWHSRQYRDGRRDRRLGRVCGRSTTNGFGSWTQCMLGAECSG